MQANRQRTDRGPGLNTHSRVIGAQWRRVRYTVETNQGKQDSGSETKHNTNKIRNNQNKVGNN